MARFSLNYFTDLIENGMVNNLPEETINIINLLASQVGAPEYIKTPQFKPRNGQSGQRGSNDTSGIIRRRKKHQDVDDTEWESIRTFQTTELKKKDGIDANLQTIRGFLNMFTQNTYDTLKSNILEEINIVNTTKTPNDLSYLCNELFNIVCSNILYSDVYAKLYKDLINDNCIFNDILMSNFKKLEEKFTTIEYYEPEENYDKFCENNKKNEILRSMCTFYVNLMKEKIIDIDVMSKIISNLFKTLDIMISDGAKKNELDELSELIYIMVVNGYELINKVDAKTGVEIYNNVERITNKKIKAEPGITNKCIFKHMDILDEISN